MQQTTSSSKLLHGTERSRTDDCRSSCSSDIDIPTASIDQEIILPPVAKFTDVVGENEENWAVFGFPEECPDSDDDRLTTSADGVFNWTWEPIDWQTECPEDVTDKRCLCSCSRRRERSKLLCHHHDFLSFFLLDGW